MNRRVLALLIAPTLLAGCFPMWSAQYRLTSSDGTVAKDTRYASYGALDYRAADGSLLALLVDAHGSSGMFVSFTTTVPIDRNPRIETDTIELLDCPPNKPGPLKIEYVASNHEVRGQVGFQWYANVPGAPSHCRFRPPDVRLGDATWIAPVVQADRGTSTPLVVDLTHLPAH